MKPIRINQPPERVFLIRWEASRKWGAGGVPDRDFTELGDLARTVGAQVVGTAFQRSAEADPAGLLGKGKIAAIACEARQREAQTLIVDNDLTPTQLRNIEQATNLKVVDRTQLILDIFARHARSREGQLQVELAQLRYSLPRLAGRGILLSRLGAGIGTRGPGEQKLEVDRRRIRVRIRRLQQALERVRTQRALQRRFRRSRQLQTLALVGYTNAGKSTLFNALTQAQVVTSPQLFSTLDPTVRAVRLASGRLALLSDTVGFIHHLPPPLIAAFRATLEELKEASLILHVTDATDPASEQHDKEVENLLSELEANTKSRLHVFNKIDLLSPRVRTRLPEGAEKVWVSALTGEGISALLERITETLDAEPSLEATFRFPLADGKGVDSLYRLGRVLSREYRDGEVMLRARVTEAVRERFQAYLVPAQ